MAEGANRRLTTIVAADIAGFSRLVGADEEGTLATLQAHRTDLIDILITQHGGRVANTAGDSILMEFPSAVNAVRCVIAIQQGMDGRNSALTQTERIEFRIGINVGDVITQGDDLLGDGVNVAARLEGLAEPGGICLSHTVHDQVRDRLDELFEDLGEQEFKNVARPVRVWKWSPTVSDKAVSVDAIALPLPDKPSIAVRPFDNMSGDPVQEYFADGIAEDVITALS
jgi:adenylate cyclase